MLGLPESILILLAAIVMAWDQALKGAPRVTAKHPGLKVPGWAHFVPLALVVIGLGMFVARQAVSSSPAEPPQAAVASPSPDGAAEPSGNGEPIATGIPVERLRGFFQGRTTSEAQRLAQPFIGARAEITGAVDNVSGTARRLVHMREADHSGRRFTLGFPASQNSIIDRLQIGEMIRARCRLSEADLLELFFDGCVLIER